MSTSDSSSGWIKIHRDILDWTWWTSKNPNFVKVFLYLLLKARTTDKVINGILVPRGHVFNTQQQIANDCHISIQELRTVLSTFCKSKEIIRTDVPVFGTKNCKSQHLIKVCNYDKYQYIIEDEKNNPTGDVHRDKQVSNRSLTGDVHSLKELDNRDNREKEDVSEPATGIPSTGAEPESIIETKVEKEKIQSIVQIKKYSEMDNSERYHELLSILDTFQKNTSIKFHRTPENLNALKQIANTKDFSRSDFRRALVCFFDEKCNWLSSKTLKTLESKFPEISSLLCETGHTYDEYLDETNKKIVRSGRKVYEITLEELGEIYKKVFK